MFRKRLLVYMRDKGGRVLSRSEDPSSSDNSFSLRVGYRVVYSAAAC